MTIMVLKLLLSYNIRPKRMEEYYRFVMGEFLPRMQTLGLVMTEVWRTIHGDYPSRLVAFASQDETVMRHALSSDEWDALETRLEEFVVDYEMRVVPARPHFQFFKSNLN